MRYGIANTQGQVSRGEVREILGSAARAGIDTLDTAIAYGDSEAAIGAAGAHNWKIITKLPAIPQGCRSVTGWVQAEVRGSLELTCAGQLEALLLHHPADLAGPLGKELLAALPEIKAAGLARKVGVSIYDPGELGPIMDAMPVDIVQVPLNPVDHRIETSGWLARLQRRGVEVHARSAFLQGLLLMDPEMRPAFFARWSAIWSEWSAWLAESGQSGLEACIADVLASSVDKIVVGVDSVRHIEEILRAAAGDGLPAPRSLHSEDVGLLNPACWPKA